MHLQQHWMIWLGGLCVGLAGIFLVRYSIERGLLGPTARIALAVATGLALHAVAETLRRRTGEAHPAFAALAGGSSIILFAAILAAMHLYSLLSPGVTFALLALVALGTMTLSLLHGPMLAIIGLLGAYSVPALVSDGSGPAAIALGYSLIISAAALQLMRYVYRGWLWVGLLAGALGWWLLTLGAADADGLRGMYLAALAYGMVAVPSRNWLLQRSVSRAWLHTPPIWQSGRLSLQPLQFGIAALVLAQAASIALGDFSADALLLWSPLLAICLLAVRVDRQLAALPWLALVSHWLSWLLLGLNWSDGSWRLDISTEDQRYFLHYALGTAALFSALCWWVGRGQADDRARTSLLVMAPVLWLALAYILVTGISVTWQWSLAAIALGVLYLYLASRQLQDNRTETGAWLILGGHFAYSLAVAMLFREATLTLALAAQSLSLAWLIKRFNLAGLDWLLKLVLAVVLLRLTLNPWLLRYPADIHWSLWSYGGSLLCTALAMLITPATAAIRPWLAAACAQLLVLFLAAETRYWLYDGEIFVREYSLLEAGINAFLWTGLGLAYHLRSRAAATLQPLYATLAGILLGMAAANQLLILTLLNPVWATQPVGATPLLNSITLAFVLPAIMAYLVYRYYLSAFRRLAGGLAAVTAFTGISLHIRHLWQGSVSIARPTGDGELYTYSAVWLLIAATSILYAGSRNRPDLYRAGMVLLLMVVAKLFLIDMAGLGGLWRVASFMGLGLSLLALAYLYRRQVARPGSEQHPAG
ncbi:MAG: DUF2339 domain-containing protein [Halioglobus sp.]